MPSQITPAVTTVTNKVDIEDFKIVSSLEELMEINERIVKQLGVITELDLKKGENI